MENILKTIGLRQQLQEKSVLMKTLPLDGKHLIYQCGIHPPNKKGNWLPVGSRNYIRL